MSEGFRAPLSIWTVDPGVPGPAVTPPVSVGIALSDWGQDYLRRAVPGGSITPLIAGVGGGALPGGIRLSDWGQEYIRRKIDRR